MVSDLDPESILFGPFSGSIFWIFPDLFPDPFLDPTVDPTQVLFGSFRDPNPNANWMFFGDFYFSLLATSTLMDIVRYCFTQPLVASSFHPPTPHPPLGFPRLVYYCSQYLTPA